MMKATRYEEEHINPKIEAMVSFSAAPAVNQALEALDRGDAVMAERKLRAHLSRNSQMTQTRCWRRSRFINSQRTLKSSMRCTPTHPTPSRERGQRSGPLRI